MISDFIVHFLGLITKLVSGFPAITFDDSIIANAVSGLKSLTTFVAESNFILPLPDMVAILSFDIAFRVAKFVLFISNWMIRRAADVIP